MTVYVVEEWEAYEGFTIVGIYVSEDEADAVARDIQRKRGVDGWHGARVEPYTLIGG